jgi:hypothetical protein
LGAGLGKELGKELGPVEHTIRWIITTLFRQRAAVMWQG